MASAWGVSFGVSFGGSWGSITSEVPETPADPEDEDYDAVAVALLNVEATPTPSNYVICDRTGFKLKPDQLKKEWDGTMVRPESFTPRHPLDLARPKVEQPTKGSERPEQQDPDIDTMYPSGVTLDDLDP